MARIEAVRQAAADPAGVALLLSGPAARELWPRRSARFGPPMRSGVGFVVDVSIDDAPPPTSGRVSITAGPDGPGGSVLRLVLNADRARAAALGDSAGRFLDDLVMAAQARSSAA